MSTFSLPGASPDATGNLAGATIHTIRGRDAILRMQGVLADLSARCGQTGVMDDVAYFLSKPGALRRIPHLMLVTSTPDFDLEKLSADDLIGVVLLYKYAVFGLGVGAFTSNDRSGRGTLVAPIGLRSKVADFVSRKLMDQGALTVLISFCDEEVGGKAGEAGTGQLSRGSAGECMTMRWARRERDIPGYLPLESTFDATLARIGQRTRSNLRYYRRRAEKQLGCTFVPAVEMGKAEFLSFNRDCMYAVPVKVATWRYDSLSELSTPLFMGVKDRDGRWLCLVGGRRTGTKTEILWQMNRNGLSVYSLSIVMRSYFLEHEISERMTRLYIEGGTGHPMRYSVVQDKVTDLAFLRRSPFAALISRLAKRSVRNGNELAEMLLDPRLHGSASRKREFTVNQNVTKDIASELGGT
jgi:hypothetical protein